MSLDNPFDKKIEFPHLEIKSDASKLLDNLKKDAENIDKRLESKVINIESIVNAPIINRKGLYDDLEAEAKKTRQQILAEHGGIESNIGITHPYWKMTK